ncbi:hypothetical protein ACHAQA_009380 [Verticillium albo-atrum]
MASSLGTPGDAASRIYNDLKKDAREIRLLDCSTLANTLQNDSMLDLKMVTHELDSVAYHTLSYVWGDASKTRPATVNGEPVNITVNLHDALRHFHHTRNKKEMEPIDYLWVDALCINQNDNIEKSHQVALMADIYAKCEAVIMWLGSEDSDSTTAIELASDWYQAIHEDDLISETYKALLAPGGDTSASSLEHLITVMQAQIQTHHPDLLSHSRLASLDAFLARPYWTRVWTLQEQVLPLESFILCGSKSLNALQFWVALTAIQRAPFPARDHGANPSSGPSSVALMVHRKRFIAMMKKGLEDGDAVPLHSELFVWSACGMYRHRPTPSSLFRDDLASELDMLYLLRSHALNSTDPRDRIFALLGLVAPEERRITPDYQMSIARVYTAFWEGEIRRAERLDMLACGGMGQSLEEADIGLPSWVPDFRRILDATPWREGLKADASAGTVPCAMSWPAAGQISLRGVIVDEIKTAVAAPAASMSLEEALWNTMRASRALSISTARRRPSDWSWVRIFFWTFTHFIDLVIDVPKHLVEQMVGAVKLSASYHFLAGVVNGALLAGANAEEVCSVLGVGTLSSPLHSSHIDDITEALLYALFPCDEETLTLVKNREGNIWFWGMGLLSLGMRNFRAHEGRGHNTLFFTEGGFTGFSKSTAAEGDRVCVVPGCRLPLILRPRVNGPEGNYQLVGWGLICDMMNGEAVNISEDECLNGLVDITLI